MNESGVTKHILGWLVASGDVRHAGQREEQVAAKEPTISLSGNGNQVEEWELPDGRILRREIDGDPETTEAWEPDTDYADYLSRKRALQRLDRAHLGRWEPRRLSRKAMREGKTQPYTKRKGAHEGKGAHGGPEKGSTIYRGSYEDKTYIKSLARWKDERRSPTDPAEWRGEAEDPFEQRYAENKARGEWRRQYEGSSPLERRLHLERVEEEKVAARRAALEEIAQNPLSKSPDLLRNRQGNLVVVPDRPRQTGTFDGLREPRWKEGPPGPHVTRLRGE